MTDHLLTMHVSDDHKQMWIDCTCGWQYAEMPCSKDDAHSVEAALWRIGHEHLAEVTKA